MSKNVAELIKYIRKQNKLTQKQFANKFFITEKTVSNYENGLRTPDLDFLNKVCEEFNLTLDFFMETSKTESNTNNLVVSEKNGKCAIYDKSQSVYLTPHLFDHIKLSKHNYHIVYKATNVMVDGAPVPEVYYSAIVDNCGNIKEMPDLIFAWSPLTFNMFDVCVAYSKKDNKTFLVNADGKKLSKGFKRIISVDFKCNHEELFDFGLYFGLEFDKNNECGEPVITSRKLIYFDGTEINVTFNNVQSDYDCKVNEFEDIEILVSHIKKYGPNIIAITPENIFQKSENYHKIIKAVGEYVEGLDEKFKCSDFLKYTVKLLRTNAENFCPSGNLKIENIDDIKIFEQNKIEKSVLKKQIYNLFAIIGLV